MQDGALFSLKKTEVVAPGIGVHSTPLATVEAVICLVDTIPQMIEIVAHFILLQSCTFFYTTVRSFAPGEQRATMPGCNTLSIRSKTA